MFHLFHFYYHTTDKFLLYEYGFYTDAIYLYPFCGLPVPEFNPIQFPSNQMSITVSPAEKMLRSLLKTIVARAMIQTMIAVLIYLQCHSYGTDMSD